MIRRLLSVMLMSAPCLSCASAAAAAPVLQPDEDCFRTHFPLALGVPASAVPPEVRFYCAAPWNFVAFSQVRAAVERAKYDIVEAAARSADSPVKSTIVRHTLPMALQQADAGPPGLGALYRVYHLLPLLYALRPGSSSAAVVEKHLDARDASALKTAAAVIDWSAPCLAQGARAPARSAVTSSSKLSDLAPLILQFKAR